MFVCNESENEKLILCQSQRATITVLWRSVSACVAEDCRALRESCCLSLYIIIGVPLNEFGIMQ